MKILIIAFGCVSCSLNPVKFETDTEADTEADTDFEPLDTDADTDTTVDIDLETNTDLEANTEEQLETDTAADLLNTDTAAELLNTDTAAELLNTDTAAELLDTDTAAELLDTDTAAELLDTDTAAELLDTDTGETFPYCIDYDCTDQRWSVCTDNSGCRVGEICELWGSAYVCGVVDNSTTTETFGSTWFICEMNTTEYTRDDGATITSITSRCPIVELGSCYAVVKMVGSECL